MEQTLYATVIRYKDHLGQLLTEEEMDAAVELAFNERGGKQSRKSIADEFEEVEVELEVDYNGGWRDFGIGPYEYWGFKGCHHQWEYDVDEDWTAIDEDGVDWAKEKRLTADEFYRIHKECLKDGQEQDKSNYQHQTL